MLKRFWDWMFKSPWGFPVFLGLWLLIGMPLVGGLVMLLHSICSTDRGARYELSTGEVVQCDRGSVERCGVRLWECSNGQSYYCQENVRELKR